MSDVKKQLPPHITLQQFAQDITPEERKIVELEKQRYEAAVDLEKSKIISPLN